MCVGWGPLIQLYSLFKAGTPHFSSKSLNMFALKFSVMCLSQKDTPPKTNEWNLKIGRNPKGKDRFPTIHFQVLC